MSFRFGSRAAALLLVLALPGASHAVTPGEAGGLLVDRDPGTGEISIQFDITVDPSVPHGTMITNQADLLAAVKIADSDDPNVNGQADPGVVGDEDPTRVVVATVPVGPMVKENTQLTAAVGEPFSYRLTVPETPYAGPVYDVRITDDLTASSADLRFLGVTKISGSGAWTPVNSSPRPRV